MRRPEPLDPVVEHDLAALEAALAGAPDADAELAALVRETRATAPRPDAQTRRALDDRVAAVLAPPAADARRPWWRGGVLRRRILVPALGTAAAVLLALVVVAGALRGGESSTPQTTSDAGPALERGGDSSAGSSAPVPGTSSGGGDSSAGSSAPAPSTSARGGGGAAPKTVAPPSTAPPGIAAPSTSAAPGVTAPAPGRQVERTVRVDLGARGDRFDAVTDGVVRTTQRAGGFVADSQIRRDGRGGTGSFVLRIPAGRLDAAVADLSRLAHVRSIEQGSTDLTGATDGTTARLRDARTRRRALVAALATASGARAARLRGRLADARARERSLDRALRALRARTSYATVELTVTAPRRAAAAPSTGGRWTPADAWRDARRGLEIAAGVLVLGLALALPLALIGGLGALAAGTIRRRRREAALDLV